MRAILVHEDIIIRKRLRQILEGLGHEVVEEAANGIQAYNAYVGQRPDLIFINLDLPLYPVGETIKRILMYDPQAACILMSRKDDNKRVFHLIEAGAKHYLNLPFSPKSVEKILSDLAGMK